MNDINKLQKIFDKKRLSEIATKRLSRDLEAMCKRFEKDEYEISGMTENLLDIPDTFKRLYSHIETYAKIGKTWSHILNKLPINKYDTVIDICPGYSPKVELALFYVKYKRKVIIVDKDTEAVNDLMKFMELFHPQFTIIPFIHDLFLPTKNQFPFVIGNHIIDDMLLYYFAKKYKSTTKELYAKEEKFISMWNKILEKEKDNQNEIVSKLTQILTRLVSPDGYLCLSQYKSYTEKMLDLDQAYLFSKKVFNEIVENLCRTDFVKINVGNKRSNKKDSYFKQKETAILKKKKL